MINTARKPDWSYIARTLLEQEQKKKRCSRPNFLDELAPKRLRMLRRLPPHKSSNSYKMTNVSVEMRDKCISLVGRDISGNYLNLQMFFARLFE